MGLVLCFGVLLMVKIFGFRDLDVVVINLVACFASVDLEIL